MPVDLRVSWQQVRVRIYAAYLHARNFEPMFVTFHDVTEVRPNMIQLPARSIVVWTNVRVKSRYRREKKGSLEMLNFKRNVRNIDLDHDRNLLFFLDKLLSYFKKNNFH